MTRWQRSELGFYTLTILATGFVSAVSIATQPPVAKSQTSFSEGEISNYAKAVLAIESKRQQVYATAKKLPEWSAISSKAEAKNVHVCDLGSSELSDNIENLCRDFFSFSRNAIESNGFNTSSFNQITRSQESDAQLRSRIQSRMMQLR